MPHFYLSETVLFHISAIYSDLSEGAWGGKNYFKTAPISPKGDLKLQLNDKTSFLLNLTLFNSYYLQINAINIFTNNQPFLLTE